MSTLTLMPRSMGKDRIQDLHSTHLALSLMTPDVKSVSAAPNVQCTPQTDTDVAGMSVSCKLRSHSKFNVSSLRVFSNISVTRIHLS